MALPETHLLNPEQRRRLKLLRLVTAVAALVVLAGVVAAALLHVVLGVVALFFAPAMVYLLVVLFEAIVPAD